MEGMLKTTCKLTWKMLSSLLWAFPPSLGSLFARQFLFFVICIHRMQTKTRLEKRRKNLSCSETQSFRRQPHSPQMYSAKTAISHTILISVLRTLSAVKLSLRSISYSKTLYLFAPNRKTDTNNIVNSNFFATKNIHKKENTSSECIKIKCDRIWELANRAFLCYAKVLNYFSVRSRQRDRKFVRNCDRKRPCFET